MQFRKLSLIHLVVLLCLVVFAYSTNSIASQKDGFLKVYFFDIGQGDAIFVEAPNGNQVLIDGGPDNAVLQKLGEVVPFYDKNIDLVVLSHPHLDHYGGLIEVLNRYDVSNTMEAKEKIVEKGLSTGFSVWQEAVKKEGANEIEILAGKEIDLGNEVKLRIIYPLESFEGKSVSNPNNSSVVLMLDYKETEILLVGDIEKQAERNIILSGADLDADILKIAHHGSKTSSIGEFLSEVSPQIAIIQVGAKNRYGHPSPEVLKRLDDYGIKYYRNDIDGDVKVVSDGTDFAISNF